MAYNLNAGYPYFSYTLSGVLIVFLVGIPLITMKSFSEERKNKTDQLLLTAPVSLRKVVMGKYLAMVSVLAVPNLIFCLFPLIIKMQGTAYLKVDYISIAVFFPSGMCVYCNRNVFILTDRKPDHSIYLHVRGSARSVSVGRDSVIPSEFRNQRRCGDYHTFDHCGRLCPADDGQLVYQRRN